MQAYNTPDHDSSNSFVAAGGLMGQFTSERCSIKTRNMADGSQTLEQPLKSTPGVLKAEIWAYYGFYEPIEKQELDKTHCV